MVTQFLHDIYEFIFCNAIISRSSVFKIINCCFDIIFLNSNTEHDDSFDFLKYYLKLGVVSCENLSSEFLENGQLFSVVNGESSFISLSFTTACCHSPPPVFDSRIQRYDSPRSVSKVGERERERERVIFEFFLKIKFPKVCCKKILKTY